MKCYLCVDLGLKSTLRSTRSRGVYSPRNEYWDEEGMGHTHYSVRYMTHYRCSLGHRYSKLKYEKLCSVEDCTFRYLSEKFKIGQARCGNINLAMKLSQELQSLRPPDPTQEIKEMITESLEQLYGLGTS